MHNTKKAYQQQIQLLVGSRLTKVIYHTCDDQSRKLIYNYPATHHVLDQAILLEMDSGCGAKFFAGCEFEQQGLDFVLEPLRHIEQATISFEEWDVSSHKVWSPLIGHTITAIHDHWQDKPAQGAPFLYPCYVEIEFDHRQKIHILPCCQVKEESPWDFSEEIIIIFDEETAHQYLEKVNIGNSAR